MEQGGGQWPIICLLYFTRVLQILIKAVVVIACSRRRELQVWHLLTATLPSLPHVLGQPPGHVLGLLFTCSGKWRRPPRLLSARAQLTTSLLPPSLPRALVRSSAVHENDVSRVLRSEDLRDRNKTVISWADAATRAPLRGYKPAVWSGN